MSFLEKKEEGTLGDVSASMMGGRGAIKSPQGEGSWNECTFSSVSCTSLSEGTMEEKSDAAGSLCT